MTKRDEKRRPVDPAALARVRQALSQVHGKRRLDVILDAPDPTALVRALPADELYFTIREIGLGDATELVQLAAPSQFRTFLDLAAWNRGAFEPKRVFGWLRAARAGSNLDPGAARRWAAKLAALDPEVLSLVLRDSLRVHDLEQDPDPHIESTHFMRTPEGKFVLEFTVEGAEYLAARGIVDDLYAEDAFMATRALAATRWDLESELQETALRWRAGRLADLGYPSLEEALSWFARPPEKPAAAPGPPARPAGFYLASLRKGTLLDRAAAALPPAARDAVELQLVAAANAVLVADAVDPGDLEAVRRGFEAARAYLEMGLETSGGGTVEDAAAELERTPLKRIFQRGFGRVLEMKWRAERLLAAGTGTATAPFLDAPLGEALSWLARKRPLYFPGLEADRAEWGHLSSAAFEPRHFLSSADLALTAAALDAAEALVALSHRLGLAPAGAARLSTVYLTALANERLGRGFAATPLAPEEVPAAARALEEIEDARLAAAGDAGQLLETLARSRAEELAMFRDGAGRAEQVSALIVR